MEKRVREIKAKKFPKISMKVTPGHFATRHSHINYYVDITETKSSQRAAKRVGEALASQFSDLTPVDTIICLDGAEVVAAFMAAALTSNQDRNINADADIAVVTPERNHSGQMIFRDNTQPMIWNKNVLLLVASATTGKTLNQAIDSVQYYSGRVTGIGSIFSAIDKVREFEIKSVFSSDDVPGYATYSAADCPECKAGRKIDAIINEFGYSRI